MADLEIPDIETAQGGPLPVAAGDKVHAFRSPNSRVVTLEAQLPATPASSSAPASQRFHEDVDNGSHYVALKAPDSLAGNVDVVLPSAAGTLVLQAPVDALVLDRAVLGMYQAKSQIGFTGYRRGKNKIWDGFADSSGINVSRSANYSLDPAVKAQKADAATPTTAYATGDQTANITVSKVGGSINGGTLSNLVDGGFAINSSDSVDWLLCNWVQDDEFRYDFGSATYFEEFRTQFDRSTSWGTWIIEVSADGSSWLTLNSFTFNSGTTDTTQTVTGCPNVGRRYLRLRKSGSTTGTVPIWKEIQFKKAAGSTTVAAMKHSSTLQTADASVTSVIAYFEIDEIDAITLNTDLTVIATCNGWTNSASCTLTNMGKGQAGRTLVRAVATGLTSGTSFAAEIEFPTAKNAPIYGLEVGAE